MFNIIEDKNLEDIKGGTDLTCFNASRNGLKLDQVGGLLGVDYNYYKLVCVM
ncbi:hypothetical protein [Streptococcus merionis]|uniref:hypothetical protein n=1 Tax=Streptococcus merionis TaxID=400065 RepID=UPI00351827B1